MSAKIGLGVMFITALVALAGIAVFSIGWTELNESIASSGWPTTDGVVELAEIQRSDRRDSEGRYRYSPQVKYRYQVNGTTFKNDRIGPLEMAFTSEADTRRVIAGYPSGKTVQVYYSSSDPSRALLEPGLSLGSLIIPGLGGCFTLLGAGGFLGALRMLFAKRAG